MSPRRCDTYTNVLRRRAGALAGGDDGAAKVAFAWSWRVTARPVDSCE